MGWLGKKKASAGDDKDEEAPAVSVTKEEDEEAEDTASQKSTKTSNKKNAENPDEVEVEFTPMFRSSDTVDTSSNSSSNNNASKRQTSCCSLIWFLLVGVSFGLISLLYRLACCGRPFKKLSKISVFEFAAVALGMAGTVVAVYFFLWPDDWWPNSVATIVSMTAVANVDYCATTGPLVCINSGHYAARSASDNHNPVGLTIRVVSYKEGDEKKAQAAMEYETDEVSAAVAATTFGKPVTDLRFENFIVQDTTLSGSDIGAYSALDNDVFLKAFADPFEAGTYYFHLHPNNGNWQLGDYSGQVDLVEWKGDSSRGKENGDDPKKRLDDLVGQSGRPKSVTSVSFSFSIET